jgi:hypothetical protein
MAQTEMEKLQEKLKKKKEKKEFTIQFEDKYIEASKYGVERVSVFKIIEKKTGDNTKIRVHIFENNETAFFPIRMNKIITNRSEWSLLEKKAVEIIKSKKVQKLLSL